MNDAERQEQYQILVQKATAYAIDKAEESALKKRIENNNASIKALMELIETDEVKTMTGETVCYGVTKRESIDEEKLIKCLHTLAPNTQCIKTKEIVDMDILESEIYHNKLSEEAIDALSKCRIIKEVPTLTIKKKKKGK